jgi:hypothetical protein
MSLKEFPNENLDSSMEHELVDNEKVHIQDSGVKNSNLPPKLENLESIQREQLNLDTSNQGLFNDQSNAERELWSATHRKLRNGERNLNTGKYSRKKSQTNPKDVKKAFLPVYQTLEERHDTNYLKDYKKKLNLLQAQYSEVNLKKYRLCAIFNDEKVDLKGNLDQLPKKVRRLDTEAAIRM